LPEQLVLGVARYAPAPNRFQACPQSCATQGPIWQRNYFEDIIHTARQFDNAHDYIVRNPENWEIDHYNSERRAREK
jgi:hypothetical protein